MELDPIIAALRTRTAATFANRVAGAAEYKPLPESAALSVPCAFVVPLDDTPEKNQSMNSIRQLLDDSFAVIVAVSNVADERGQGAVRSIHAIRAALWSALLGWQPSGRHDGIEYQGGQLISLDRARLWYQFEFSAAMEIEPADGWQEGALADLPPFEGGTLRLDAIDPHDPNVADTPRPDGRFESGFVFPKTGTLPT